MSTTDIKGFRQLLLPRNPIHFKKYTSKKTMLWDNAVRMFLVMTLLLGLGYPVLITFMSTMIFNQSSIGYPLSYNGQIVGYKNIGQKFTDDKYFHGRPSAVDYNAAGSGGSNLGATNESFREDIYKQVESYRLKNDLPADEEVPSEMIMASGSGLDPHISPEAAMDQVKRIAAARNISEKKLVSLINDSIEYPQYGFLGNKRINVLILNIELEKLDGR